MWKRTGPLRKARGPKLSLQDISSPRIQPELDGVRIGQLSDIHVRTGVKPRALHAGVEMLNALKPDFVVLTGDYVCLSVRSLPLLTEALKKLEIPTYATLGNPARAWKCSATSIGGSISAGGICI